MTDWLAHDELLRKYAFYLCRQHRQDALDLVQDTYLRLYGAKSFDGKQPRAFAVTVMRNHYYSSKRKKTTLPMPAFYDAPAVDDQHSALELKQTLQRIPQVMSDDQAVVLTLRTLGHDVLDVARILNIAEGTVKSRLKRARALLAT